MNRLAHSRSAFTLIELSITMAAGGTLMLLAIGLVHQTMSLSSMGRRQADHQRTTTRLATQFRHDVHRAKQSTVESPSGLQLILAGDNRVSYRAQGNRLTRLQPLEDGTTRRDVFTLHEHSSVAFRALDEPSRVELTILRYAPLTDAQPRPDRGIQALLGRLIAHQQGELSP